MISEMITEIVIVAIIALVSGALLMKLLLKIKRVEILIDRSEKRKYNVMNNPEKLLEKLNENGIMIDDGDEILFSVEMKDGRKQLVQTIKKDVAATGVPKVTENKKVIEDV